MKSLIFSLTIAGALALTGCSSLVSLNPFVTDQNAVMDPALVGTWISSDGKETYWIKQDGAGYLIRYSSDTEEQYQFRARLMAADGAKILDLAVAKEDGFQLALHIPFRISIDGNNLRMSTLQSDWLKKLAAQQLATTVVNDRLVITAPSDVVAKFLARFGVDPQAADEPDTLRRFQ